MNVVAEEGSRVLTIGHEDVPLSELPDIQNLEEVLEYANAVAEQYPEERGAKTFVSAVGAYIQHLDFADVHLKKIISSHKALNGIRPKRGPQGQTIRGKRSLAVRFYNTLSAEAVRDYCTALNVNHNSYETVDERFTAMAEAQHPEQP